VRQSASPFMFAVSDSVCCDQSSGSSTFAVGFALACGSRGGRPSPRLESHASSSSEIVKSSELRVALGLESSAIGADAIIEGGLARGCLCRLGEGLLHKQTSCSRCVA